MEHVPGLEALRVVGFVFRNAGAAALGEGGGVGRGCGRLLARAGCFLSAVAQGPRGSAFLCVLVGAFCGLWVSRDFSDVLRRTVVPAVTQEPWG